MAKIICRNCNKLKHWYGKDTCRTCYKSNERLILAEARQRAQERFEAHLSLAVLFGGRDGR